MVKKCSALYFFQIKICTRTGGGRGTHFTFWSTFCIIWSILGFSFGAHRITEGRSAGRFSVYLALRKKVEKQTFVNN